MKKPKNEGWRDLPDEVLLSPLTKYHVKARSLRPGPKLIEAALEGDPEAIEIQNSWKARFKIVWMSPARLRALSERCYVLFIGQPCEVLR